MSQGTDYGEHCSLERQAEIHFQSRRNLFLVHRLDREAVGSTNVSLVDVTLETGRLHQIRRHFALLGYPVIGDPKYGSGNKNQGMHLYAVRLEFACPFDGDARVYDLRLINPASKNICYAA